MGEFKKLFQVKRILAMALAVALAVTSAPVTAQAAPENPEQAETNVEGSSTEDNKEGSGEDAAAGTVVTAAEESDTPAEPADAVVEASEMAEPDQSAAEKQEDAEPVPAEPADVVADQAVPETGTDLQETVPSAEVKASAGYSIKIDEEYAEMTAEYTYEETYGLTSNGFWSQFYLESAEGDRTYLSAGGGIVNTVTYQWLEGEKALGDAKLLGETGELPKKAGTYTLKLELPAKEGDGGYPKVEGTFSYEITQAVVTVTFDDPAKVVPGTAVTDVTLPQAYIVGSDDKYFTVGVKDDPSTADTDESKTNEVELTPVIKDAETGEELKDGSLAADKEYVITAVPKFIGDKQADYERNYRFAACDEKKLAFEELKETRLSVTLDAKFDDAKFTTTRDAAIAADENGRTVHVVEAKPGTPIADVVALFGTAPASKLETKDGKDDKGQDKWKEITAAEDLFEGAWYTAADYTAPWKEADKTFCALTVGGKMDAAPTAAGAYVYRYSYKGDQKEYAGSFADVLVIVEVPEIIVKPSVADDTVFYDGQPVSDVLAKIDYVLPYADGRTGEYPKADNMWGTSYDDSGKTQPYKPDFVLIEKTKDGEETTYNSSNGAKLKVGNTYYVRFTGNKAVYNAAGMVQDRRGIMAGVDSMDPETCGFKVKTGADVYEKYQQELKVEKAAGTINVDDIATDTYEEVRGLKLFTKEYDGQRIFSNHSDYKKAKLGDADSSRDFVYTWKKSRLSYEDLKETYKDADNKDVFEYSEEAIENSFNTTLSVISPTDAGFYRLEVTYKDPAGKTFAEPAYVYFVIQPQEITLNLSEEVKKGFTGYTGGIYDVIASNADALAQGTSMKVKDTLEGKPSKSEDWKNFDALSEKADYAYQLEWQVSVKETKKDADGKETVEYKPYYGELTTEAGLYFVEPIAIDLGYADEEYGYIAFNSVDSMNDNFTVKWDAQNRLPITVKEAENVSGLFFAGITTGEGCEVLYKEKTYDGDSIYELITKAKLDAMNAPGTVGEDGKTLTPVTDAKPVVYTVTYSPYGEGDAVEKTYDKLPTEAADWAWAKDSGYYEIQVKFAGNDKYLPLDEYLATISVNQKELTLTLPALEKTYEAGKSVGDALEDAEKAFKELSGIGLTGFIKEEEEYFTKKTKLPNGDQGYLAWYYDGEYYAPEFAVYDKEWQDSYTWSYLENYDVCFETTEAGRYSLKMADPIDTGWGLSGEAAKNYTIGKADPASTPIKVGRGASSVWLDAVSDGKKLDKTDKISDGKAPVAKDHQVTVLDAIPYAYDEKPEGNLVWVTIEAPEEYQKNGGVDWTTVSYEKSIKNHAGKNLIGEIVTYFDNITNEDGFTETRYGLRFKYNATDKEDLTFSIRWAADYNEDFTILFSKAEVLGNLRDAVAPKSLAFNGALTAMVVGQTQNLDVKITKEQTGDVICLGYEVQNEVPAAGNDTGKVMHVSEHGVATALGVGKATVAVYPMHLVDGKKVKIETDAKGKQIKPTTVNITVKDVSGPKISKVIAGDTYVKVQYALPKANDGYRREIYVLEGKNLKQIDFENKINEMKNQQWKGIFAAQPIFMSSSNEKSSRVYDTKKHAYIDTVNVGITLNPKPLEKKDYTVYVRNVSAMRSFEDGCKVALSYAGNTKSFVPTATEADALVATLKDFDVYKLDGEEVKEQPTPDEIRDANSIEYKVPLAKKSVQISLEALFRDKAGDGTYLPLPLKGEDKKNYTDPKIAYYFYEWIYDGYDAYTGKPKAETTGYTTASKIGTIAKNGKLTLKDTGKATIYAVDTVSGVWSEALVIDVTAEANSIAPRKANMQVGQRIALKNLVDYKEDSLKLGQNYNDAHARIDVKAAKAALGENESFIITDDGYLVAVNVGNAEFDLKDENIDGTAHIRATAKALDAVKGLNIINVIDNRFDVRFEMNPYAEAYRIKVTDGRGTTVRSIYVENLPFNWEGKVLWDGVDQTNGWTRISTDPDDDWGGNEYNYWWNWTHNREHWVKTDGPCEAHMINGKMTLTYEIDKLVQTSKYNVEVTTLYKEVEPGKPASKSVTTTKLPAYDYCVDDSDYVKGSTRDIDGYPYGQGMYFVTKNGDYVDSDYPFVSGNTYSLKAGDYNKGARYAGTDTLTWSSSNTKVASVQATSGGYSAVLKALKDGETVIEVKSAVLKGVIARYTITVSTVGNAYNSYGENEYLREDGGDLGKEELVTKMVVGVPVAVDVQDGFDFEFTATEEGYYKLCDTRKGDTLVSGIKLAIGETINTPDGWKQINKFPVTYRGHYDEAFTGRIVIKRTGTTETSYGDEFKNRKAVKAGEQFETQYNAWYVFTAPEDGFYKARYTERISNTSSYSHIFAAYNPKKDGDAVIGGEQPDENVTPVLSSQFYYLKKDQLIYLRAENFNGYEITTGKVEKVSFETLKAEESITISRYSSKWYEFTAAEAGEYELARSDNQGSLSMYKSDADSNYEWIGASDSDWNDDNTYYVNTYSLTANQKVYVYIYAGQDDTTLKISKKAAPATP